MAIMDDWMVISAGVNINSTPDAVEAVSLKDICGSGIISSEKILESILAKLDQRLGDLSSFGFLSVKKYWLRYINEMDCKVIVRNGRDSLAGIFRGIDDSGKLILENGGRNLLISSGDLFSNIEGVTVNYE
jgi:biotin-(acetyl-CoA carboxylase) ligase